jgi:hypothetical protein
MASKVYEYNTEFMRLLDEADRRIRETGGIPHNEFWTRVKQEAKAAQKGKLAMKSTKSK